MDLQGAIQEAGRCLLCHDAPCNTGCGADNDPATFIRQLRLGNIKGAVRTMRRNNILAATCAQVCPTCRLCEQGCARSGIDEPIRIAEIQAFLAEYEREQGMQVLQAPAPGDRKVAVVGAGPAGLSAAATLWPARATRRWSSRRCRRPGASCATASPTTGCSPDLVEHEIGLVRGWACSSSASTRSPPEAELEGLFEQGFDAVFLAPGYDRPYSLGLGDEASTGLYAWSDFLAQSKDAGARRGLAAVVIRAERRGGRWRRRRHGLRGDRQASGGGSRVCRLP